MFGEQTFAQLRTGFRLVSRGTLARFRFCSPSSSKVVVCGHCLVTLSLTVNQALKWILSLPILMQESFWWWQCSDWYKNSHTSCTYLPPPPPFFPSLISLMVSVDIKHHVYTARGTVTVTSFLLLPLALLGKNRVCILPELFPAAEYIWQGHL